METVNPEEKRIEKKKKCRLIRTKREKVLPLKIV